MISVLLAAALWVGVSFAPLGEIIFFGNKLSFARTDGIAHVAWIVWLYCLIRYVAYHLQYQKPEEKFLFYFRNALHNAYSMLVQLEVLKQGKFPLSDYYHVVLVSMTFLGASCRIRVKQRNSATAWEEIEPIKLSVSPTATWFVRTRVLAIALFGRAYTSEYYLPYLVALLPIVVTLIR